MHNDEKPEPTPNECPSLTKIGWEWDISNRVLGAALEDAGYKWSGGATNKALDEGLAVRKGSGYKWSSRAVGEFILKVGCSERSKPKPNNLVACKWIVV